MMRLNAGASNSPTGLSPQQVSQAYGFNQIEFNSGSSSAPVVGDGSGQTIAIVDAYDDPKIKQDLATFDGRFGLAAPPSFSVQYAGGARPPGNTGWSEETSLDVEWAHAMAPNANIVLVEASSDSLGALLQAVDTARNLPNVSVVSMSWGSSEFSSETSYDSHFTTPAGHIGITFVASAGDSGAPGVWPALSPNVLAVGGTSLNVTSNGSYVSETAWSDSGGGVSQYEGEPAYQQSVQSYGARTSPDVAYDADPNTGFSVYDSYSGDGWFTVGGTSAGAPQWSALVAIADQARGSAGTLANAQADLYNLPANDFHDITSGGNGNSAGPGYDLVTGLGTPVANLVVDGLAGITSTPSPTQPTPPPSPVLAAPVATASALSTTSAQLTWGLVGGAQGYNVFEVVQGQDVYLGAVGASTTSVQVTGLTAGSTDSFIVQAYNNNDTPSTANSSVVTVALPAPVVPTRVSAPQNVTVNLASSTSAVVSWSDEAAATGYNIYWSNGYQVLLLGTVSGSTSSVTITGLPMGATSYFLVEAFNRTSYADSAWAAVTTPFYLLDSGGFGQFSEQWNAFWGGWGSSPAMASQGSGYSGREWW
ncbi:MAG TPA: fibronectin type III domain-containing protein [Pirellulales bacterium]